MQTRSEVGRLPPPSLEDPATLTFYILDNLPHPELPPPLDIPRPEPLPEFNMEGYHETKSLPPKRQTRRISQGRVQIMPSNGTLGSPLSLLDNSLAMDSPIRSFCVSNGLSDLAVRCGALNAQGTFHIILFYGVWKERSGRTTSPQGRNEPP